MQINMVAWHVTHKYLKEQRRSILSTSTNTPTLEENLFLGKKKQREPKEQPWRRELLHKSRFHGYISFYKPHGGKAPYQSESWNSTSSIARSHKILNFNPLTLLEQISIKFTTCIIIWSCIPWIDTTIKRTYSEYKNFNLWTKFKQSHIESAKAEIYIQKKLN